MHTGSENFAIFDQWVNSAYYRMGEWYQDMEKFLWMLIRQMVTLALPVTLTAPNHSYFVSFSVIFPIFGTEVWHLMSA